MDSRTASMPTPRPDRSVTSAAVEKPGKKMRSIDGFLAHAGNCVRSRQTALDGRPADAVRIDPSTIVLNLNDDMFAIAARAQNDRGDRGFPRGCALGAQLNAVIHRVAHDVEQRLEQHLDDRLVGLGLLALDEQPHRLRQRF